MKQWASRAPALLLLVSLALSIASIAGGRPCAHRADSSDAASVEAAHVHAAGAPGSAIAVLTTCPVLAVPPAGHRLPVHGVARTAPHAHGDGFAPSHDPPPPFHPPRLS